MGGQSCTTQSHMAAGDDIELVTFDSAQLYLVDEDETVPMQHGKFRLVLTKQLHSPLAALVAVVQDVEWPVGRDCPVVKLGRGCYTFCLPRMLYGLVLSDPIGEVSSQLEFFLMRYCTYEDHSKDIGGAADYASAARDYWNDVARKVETVSSRLSWDEHHHREPQRKKRVSLSLHSEPARGGEISPRMMKRVQQARRLSAISKLFSRALHKGAINNMKHVTNTARSVSEAAEKQRDEAVASVDAYEKVVEAFESAGRSIALASSEDVREGKDGVETAWTLNRCGVHMLLGAVAASTAINLSKSVSSAAEQYKQEHVHRPPLPSSSKPTRNEE